MNTRNLRHGLGSRKIPSRKKYNVKSGLPRISDEKNSAGLTWREIYGRPASSSCIQDDLLQQNISPLKIYKFLYRFLNSVKSCRYRIFENEPAMSCLDRNPLNGSSSPEYFCPADCSVYCFQSLDNFRFIVSPTSIPLPWGLFSFFFFLGMRQLSKSQGYRHWNCLLVPCILRCKRQNCLNIHHSGGQIDDIDSLVVNISFYLLRESILLLAPFRSTIRCALWCIFISGRCTANFLFHLYCQNIYRRDMLRWVCLDQYYKDKCGLKSYSIYQAFTPWIQLDSECLGWILAAVYCVELWWSLKGRHRWELNPLVFWI